MEDKSELIQKIKESIRYLKQHIELPEGLKVVLKSDCKNSKDFFGKTAYYDPENKKIVLYITNRHPKDVLRSLFHECLHSYQDTRGDFQNLTSAEEGYAQKNPHLREMEREAYEKGNMLFRDWEDDYKKRRQHTTMSEKKEQHIEETFTDIFSGRRKSLNESLMKKFGIVKENDVFKKKMENILKQYGWEKRFDGEARKDYYNDIVDKIISINKFDNEIIISDLSWKDYKKFNNISLEEFESILQEIQLGLDENVDENEEQNTDLEEKHVEIRKNDPEWTKHKQKEGPERLISPPEKKWVAKEGKKK